MRKTLTLLALLVSLAVTGCALPQPKTITREEYVAMTTRVYKNENRENVISQAERLLKLSDESDTSFVHNENGFTAQRRWVLFLIIASASGFDIYDFSTEQKGKNVHAKLNISGQSTAHTAMVSPVIGGGGGLTASPVSSSSASFIMPDKASYDLFWSRMDYLLGKSDKWLTCEDMRALVKQGESEGTIEALCMMQTVDDKRPD